MDYSEKTGVSLRDDQVEMVTDFKSTKMALQMAIQGPNPTVALESMVGIQSFCDDITLKEHYDNKPNLFTNYQNGFITSANVYLQELLDIMLDGQHSGKNFIFTGHSRVGTGKNISGDDWVSQVLSTSRQFADRIQASFANIFHIGSTVSTVKPLGKVRANGMSTNIYVDMNPHFPAKNRLGLSAAIPYPASPRDAFLALCQSLQLNPTTGRRQ